MTTLHRLWWFARLVFRPHPYSGGMPPVQRWTACLLGPSEAWRIAGIVSGATYGRSTEES